MRNPGWASLARNGGTTALEVGEGDFVVINSVRSAALTAADFII